MKDTRYEFRCTTEQKTRWMDGAKARGKDLAEDIIADLDHRYPPTNG